jgi:hypothetical protein
MVQRAPMRFSTFTFVTDGIEFENHLGPKRREIECTRVIESPAVTHLRYRVVK